MEVPAQEAAKPQGRTLSATLHPGNGGGTTIHAETNPEPTTDHLPIITEEAKLDRSSQRDPRTSNVLLDIGWDGDLDFKRTDLVEGLDTEELWILVRRFNKHVFHIKKTSPPEPGELDFNVVSDQEFSPNKLRAQFERLYMGLILSVLATTQHVMRLRNWREPRRTSCICLVYFTAWTFKKLLITCLSTLIALILWPEFRSLMFPPAPLAMVNILTGELSGPHAGVLGSTDTATGAPENVRGESVENEASNFVTGVAAIAVNVLTDEDPQHSNNQKGGSSIKEIFPPPNELATKTAVMKDKAGGVDRPSQDKTKQPMEEIMWAQMQPMMHLLCLTSDFWERLKNMLDPTAPFPKQRYRLRLASPLAIFIMPLLFIPGFLLSKMVGLCCGFVIFGDPLVRWSYQRFDLQRFDLTNTFFHGVPTDAQLAITLLRVGEAQNSPLPPPPLPQKGPPKEPVELHQETLDGAGADRPLGATERELLDAADGDKGRLRDAGGGDQEVTEDKHGGSKRKKLFDIFKFGARGTAKTIIASDRLRAKHGNTSAKARFGAASDPKKPCMSGPLEFQASYDGKVGFLYLTTDPAAVALCFSEASATGERQDVGKHEGGKEAHPLWMVPVKDIVEMNKFSGYGTKTKLMAGWALNKAIMDGIEIVDRSGKSRVVTAMPRRDQLFNRICALGQYSWKIV